MPGPTGPTGPVGPPGPQGPTGLHAPISVVVGGGTASCTYQKPPGSSCTARITLIVNASGGSGNYSYSWSKVSGPENISDSPSGNQFQVTWTAAADNGQSTQIKCITTDNVYGTTYTDQYTIYWSISSNA